MNRKATLSLLGMVAVFALWGVSCASEEPPTAEERSGARGVAALQSSEVSAWVDMDGGWTHGDGGWSQADGGWANEPLTLQGAVAGDGGEPSFSWSFVAAEGTDPGASCIFGSPGAASTTFSCTHGGTYTVTLTASRGGSPPATASATVTLRNASKVTLVNLPGVTRQTTWSLWGYTTPGLDKSAVDSAWFSVDGGDAIPVEPRPDNGYVTASVSFSEGIHVVRLSAQSKAGHLTLQQRTMRVDLSGPGVMVSEPDSTTIYDTSVVPVRYTAVDPTSPLTLYTHGVTTKVDAGTHEVIQTVDLKNTGWSELLIKATDGVGNETVKRVRVFVRYKSLPYCGDGKVTGSEACDDSNIVTEKECPYSPQPSTCTGCSADCTQTLEGLTGPSCGDKVKNGPEACDDGNTMTETSCPVGQVSCKACAGDCSTELTLSGLCTRDEQCGSGNYCDSRGVCASKLESGVACSASNQCGSGSCADGVCCNTACGGACDSCVQPGNVGTCTASPAGSVGSPLCAPYVCNGTSASCPATCTSNAQCGSGNSCNASSACVTTCVIGGGTYAQGTSNPSNPCQVCDLSQSTTAWSNKPVNTSCRATAYGNWSACSIPGGSCADTEGSQSRTVTTYACTSTGTCAATSESQTETCWRNRDGDSCGFSQDCGECSGFDGDCGMQGTRSCTMTHYTCSGGSCNESSSETYPQQTCSRDTNGMHCGAEVECEPCRGFSDTCDESGTQKCTGRDFKCSGGTCQPLELETWPRDCSVNKSNEACEEEWTPVGECNSEGQQLCKYEAQYCQSGGCSGGWWTTFLYKPCGDCKSQERSPR